MGVVYHLSSDDLRQTQQEPTAAEAAGFKRVVAMQNVDWPFRLLAVEVLATLQVQIGTAVAIAFLRSPTITARAAWDLNKASAVCFYFGLGGTLRTGLRLLWSPAASLMRDQIGAVRAVWQAWEKETPMDYHNERYNLTLTSSKFAPRLMGLRRIPIAKSAVRRLCVLLSVEWPMVSGCIYSYPNAI